MADQTDQPKPVSDPNGVVASGDMTKKHRKWHRKNRKAEKNSAITGKPVKAGFIHNNAMELTPKRLVVVAIVLLLLSAGSAYYWVQKHPSNPNHGADYTFKYAGPGSAVVTKATSDLQAGVNPNTALSGIDNFIAQKKYRGNNELAWLYSVKAALQFQYVDKKAALDSITKAIEVYPAEPTYYVQAAQYVDSSQAAKDYYKKALTEYDAGPPKGYDGPGRDYFVKLVQVNQ